MIYCLVIKMNVSRLIQIHMDYFDNKTWLPPLPQVCGKMYDFIQNILCYHSKQWILRIQWGGIIYYSLPQRMQHVYPILQCRMPRWKLVKSQTHLQKKLRLFIVSLFQMISWLVCGVVLSCCLPSDRADVILKAHRIFCVLAWSPLKLSTHVNGQ